jgi:hypothetical protein
MESKTITTVRVLKRLRAAVGYYELGMIGHALRCVDSLADFGGIGFFGLVADVLRDEFAKGGKTSTANALEIVACMLPAPGRRAVRMTLAACYGPENAGGSAREGREVARIEPREGVKGATL